MSRKPSLSTLMQRRHLKAVRMLGYALVLDDFDGWDSASSVWAVRLSAEERAALAFAALRTLDPDQARDIAETALGGAGMPMVPFSSEVDEAAFWVNMATPDELAAYCLATFSAMPRHRQAEFLDFVGGRLAA